MCTISFYNNSVLNKNNGDNIPLWYKTFQSVAKKQPFIAKITLFVQVIQKLPKDLIKSLAKSAGKSSGQTFMPRNPVHGITYLACYSANLQTTLFQAFCRTPLLPAHFAPSPVVSIYKTLEIEFFAIKNLINIFLTYYNLYKFASAIGPFRADTFNKFSPNDSR